LEHPFELIGVAIVLFVATNLDDVFLLIAFFADPALKTRQILIGQYVGMAALYAASVVASLTALVIPVVYIGLLGLIPIGMGVFQLREFWSDDDKDEPQTARGGALAVAAITVASGGDNIAVYTPVFALRTLGEILAIGCVFAVLVALWVGGAHWLARHPTLGLPIGRWGHRVVPFVLIAIGVIVFVESRTWELLL
jgi:cadmium resistance protein CadD (predicted permease)